MTVTGDVGMLSVTFDLGQTGLRARVSDERTILTEFAAEGYRGALPLDAQLLAVAERAAEAFGVRRFDTMAGGLTGVHGVAPSIDLAAHRLSAEFGIHRLIVADDAVTSYFGAMGEGVGVVAAVGTGLVALGRGPAGQLARVDGLGPMLGDEGAGWWIGRQGLIAALSAADGRDHGSAALLTAARDRYGPLHEIPALVARAPSPTAAVAAFALDVADRAREGDVTARGIWDAASRFIAGAIIAGAERAHLTSPFDYALVGGIARATDLLEPGLTAALHARFADIRHVQPKGSGLDGAAALLRLDEIDPSDSLIRQKISTEG